MRFCVIFSYTTTKITLLSPLSWVAGDLQETNAKFLRSWLSATTCLEQLLRLIKVTSSSGT